jgi:hypothetical protein
VALANNCIFASSTSGTGTFSVSPAAVTGYYPPLLAGAINGSSYSYKAQSSDLSQWECGIGTYTTEIDPQLESVDNTRPGGDGGTSPIALNAPPTFNNGDLLVAYLGVPVTTGDTPGTLGISGGGATWNVLGPAGPIPTGEGDFWWVWMLWKQAASEPSSWTFSWNNSTGGWLFWQIAAFTTGGSTVSLDNYNGQSVVSETDSILEQTGLAAGIELRVMLQNNWGGDATNTQYSDNFISIQPYTGAQAAFGYAILNNQDTAPAIPNVETYTGFTGAAVFSFSGNPDTLSRDFVLSSSNFNQPEDFTAAPTVLLSAAAHELPNAPVTVVDTATYTVQDTDVWLLFTVACTVTLPAVGSWPNRELHCRSVVSAVIASAADNVVPVSGGAPGSTILPATAGSECTLKCDGENYWDTVETNVPNYGAPLAGGVLAWPAVLPSLDVTLGTAALYNTNSATFTTTVDIGTNESPFVIILSPFGVSSDTVTIAGVSVPFAAAGSNGAIFAGVVAGFSGSQTMVMHIENVFNQTVMGVFYSQFSLDIVSYGGETGQNSGSIACAGDSILLGVFQANGGSVPSDIDFTGSTALPTSRTDTSNSVNSDFTNCCALWDISAAETFDFTGSSSGSFSGVDQYIWCDVALAPAVAAFRTLVDSDLPAGAPNAGNVVSPGAQSISLGSTGPTGAAATPAGYLTFVDSTNTTRYVPYF